MEGFLLKTGTMLSFSYGLLAVMIIVLVIFTGILLAKLYKLKEYIRKEKVDIAATIISIVVVAMGIGGIIAYLFCMNSMLN